MLPHKICKAKYEQTWMNQEIILLYRSLENYFFASRFGVLTPHQL